MIKPSHRVGQVYLDTRTYNLVTIYAIEDGLIRVVVAKTRRGKIGANQRAFWSLTWKNGIPEHYVLQYEPPEHKPKEKRDAED